MNAFLSGDTDERKSDAFGAAGLRHHLSQHGSECDYDRDVPERDSDACLEGLDDRRKRHSARCGQRERDRHQCDKRIQFETRDQEHEDDNCYECKQEQGCAMMVGHCLIGFEESHTSPDTGAL